MTLAIYKLTYNLPKVPTSLVDRLLSRGGLDSMLYTLWIIIGALTFGTLLEEFGMLTKLINPVLLGARPQEKLFATTAATAIGLNIFAGDQYIALVLPARMFRVEFQKRGLQPQNLSRPPMRAPSPRHWSRGTPGGLSWR